MIAISPTQSNLTEALGQFLVATLGLTPAQIIVGQQNRVPEPQSTDFVVMTPIRFERLATNIDGSVDVKFIGSIVGTVLTVTSIDFGEISVGSTLSGPNVAAGTVISKQTSGPSGGIGTYTVSISQTIGSETLSAGSKTLLQEARAVVQLDFHSQGSDQTAGDNAQKISTMLRDEYGVNFFANLAPPLNGIAPLHADDPRQTAFENAESQIEWRWVLDAHFQVNQVVSVPQTYGDGAAVELVSVEAEFPPI